MNVFALTGDPEILCAAFPVHQMFDSHVHEKVGLHVHERVEQEKLFQEKDYHFLVLLDELLHKNVEQAEAFPVPKMVEPEEQICEMFERIELVLAHSNSFGLLLGSETSGSLSAKDLKTGKKKINIAALIKTKNNSTINRLKVKKSKEFWGMYNEDSLKDFIYF